MNMESIQEDKTLNVSLAETLDISTVQNLHAELRVALEDGDPICLHGSAVERVDTAALQVLAALFRYAAERQGKLEMQSPSEALVHSAKLLGMAGYIGLNN
jgi:anti-anti-sigma regulatory factor